MRLRTDSITHLVKIVAGEVFDEKMKEVRLRDKELRDDAKEYFSRAGEFWSQIEDDLLVQEIDSILDRLATKHGRTTGAIRSRISQKEIL